MTFLGDAMIACEKDTPEESKGFFHLYSPYVLFLIVVKKSSGHAWLLRSYINVT